MNYLKQTFATLLLLCSSSHIFVNGILYKGTVKVTNEAPLKGTCQTPVWVGIHRGAQFDTYNDNEALPPAFESLVEDGNNTAVSESFANTPNTVWDGTVGTGPICSGETVELGFVINVEPGKNFFFSYASMVIPSNDAWVSNGDPTAYLIINYVGSFQPVSFTVPGTDVLDGGTEVNDEIPANTAFFGQVTPNTGVDEVDGVVTAHPGFKPVGSGGILDDPDFANADFTVAGYEMMSIEVEATLFATRSGFITITNEAPLNGTCQTPVWVGIHDGTFDTYNQNEDLPPAFESLVEDGNNTAVAESFANTMGTVWDGTVGSGPICPGETVSIPFEAVIPIETELYFSYASMVLPSNDAWISNGDPVAYPVISTLGLPLPLDITVPGTDVLDGGTEVNDEIPANTAFFGQVTPNTGVDEEAGVVTAHPGFKPAGSGGILDDPHFANADFTVAGYDMITIIVSREEQTPPPTISPTPAPTTSPTSAPTASPTNVPTSPPTTSPTAVPSPAPTTAPTTVPPTLIDSALAILLFPITLVQNAIALIISLIFGSGTVEE